MTSFKVGDFVWVKMTGYPYWPGKVTQPRKTVKKPSKQKEMYFVRFYGTGDFAWIRAELIHAYEENKDKYANGSKRQIFVTAVKKIEEAIIKRTEGLPGSDEEGSREQDADKTDSDDSDEVPLAKKSRTNNKEASMRSYASNPAATISAIPKKRISQTKRKTPKKPSQEETVTLINHRSDLPSPVKPSKAEGVCPLEQLFVLSSQSSDEPQRSPDSTAEVDSTTNLSAKDIIPTDKKIGFLGLGIMGAPMAMNLIRTGHDVTVWNRSQSRCTPLIAAGAKQGTSPADVVQQCDITFSCVSDADAVRDLVIGNSAVLQGMGSGKGYVEMSTVDTDTIKEIAEAITMRGGRFLEAPVTGSKKPAEQGNLVILAAGDRSLYMDGYSCFEAMGKKTFFLGELGCGAHTKLIVNMLIGTFMSSLAEGLSLAEKAGLDQYTLLDVLGLTDISCPLVKTKGSAILEGHFPANFPLKHQQKDMKLALQMGETLEQPLHVAGAANELYKRTKAIGFGDRDMSCVYRAVNV